VDYANESKAAKWSSLHSTKPGGSVDVQLTVVKALQGQEMGSHSPSVLVGTGYEAWMAEHQVWEAQGPMAQ
jgi:hypothetical protein